MGHKSRILIMTRKQKGNLLAVAGKTFRDVLDDLHLGFINVIAP